MPAANTALFPGSAATIADLLNQHDTYKGTTQPTLAAAIVAGDTSATLAAGTGATLPADNFAITIDDEIIFVAARSTDSLTGLTRGTQGTTAAAHASGADVNANITAWHHNQLAAEIIALEGWQAWRQSIDRPPTTADSLNDEFDAAALDTSRWTENFDTRAQATLARSRCALRMGYQSAPYFAWLSQPAPAPPWQFTARLDLQAQNTPTIYAGLAAGDDAGKIVTFGWRIDSALWLSVDHWTNQTTLAANAFQQAIYPTSPVFWQFFDYSGYLDLSIGPDGINWSFLYAEAETTWLNTSPTKIGFGISTSNGGQETLSVDWFRGGPYTG